MEQKYFIGIDLSKKKIDLAVLDASAKVVLEKEVKNTTSDLTKFIVMLLKKLNTSPSQLLICCESTGIYSKPLKLTCQKLNCVLWVENALKIKRAATDFRGKTDRKDALRIAEYALRYKDKQLAHIEPTPEIAEIGVLQKARHSLQEQIKGLKNQLREAKTHDTFEYSILNTCYKKALNTLTKELKAINSLIQQKVDENKPLKQNVDLLKSIPGIGLQNALGFIIYTQNFNRFKNANQLACFAGVVPFPTQSGTIQKRDRVSHFANKTLKALLHMAAMATVRIPGELQNYFIRKVAEGKNKMLVINNIRNKLVKRIFAVIERQTPYSDDVQNIFL
jgi:transposase